MGFVEGLRAGTEAARFYDAVALPRFNPFAAMAYVRRPTAAPRIIRDNAAELALKQKQLELEERKIALAEEQARKASALAERQQVFSEINQDRVNTLAQRKQGLEERKFETSLGMTREKQQEQRDFALAKWGLATNNPQPIIDYFQKYGNKGVYVESMEFGPDGDILVKFSNQKKPAYFKSKDEFYTAFMGFADPQVQKEIIKSKTELEKARISAAGKKAITNPFKVTLAQAYKEYDARFREPSGELKPNAPDRDTWARNFIAENMVAGQVTPGAQAQQQAGQPQLIQEKVDRRTGNRLRRWSDGTQELLAPTGEVQYVKSPDGVIYKQGSIGFEKYRKTQIPPGQASVAAPRAALPRPTTSRAKYKGRKANGAMVLSGKMPARQPVTQPNQKQEAKTAIPAQKGALTSKQTVKATYVDKETGDTIEVRVDADGNVTKRVIKKGKKKEKKD